MNMQHVSLQSVRNKLHFGRSESETAQFGRNARSDWQVIFFAFLVLNVLLLAGSILVYQRINRGEIFLVSKKEPLSIRILNQAELAEAAEFLASKKASFETLRGSRLVIPGPGPARPKK